MNYLIPVFLSALIVVGISTGSAAAARPAADEGSPFVISYAGAAGWLDNLPPEDQDDQIRDYTLVGLASILGLDLPELRNALYDQTPVRDSLFWDLAANRSGPGRGLYDGESTLHVLVPLDDPYAARTIGLVLDDHRKDTGEAVEQVVLYRYTIDATNHQVILEPEPAQSTPDVRSAYGYVEMPIITLADLERFLSLTQHLSQVTVQDGTLHAGGWNWPGVPTGSVTAEDLSVLQRGYVTARGEPVTVEGFIVEDMVQEYDLDLVTSDEVQAYAAELDEFFTAWARATKEDEYVKLLTDYESLVLTVIIDDDDALRLERSRAGQSDATWFSEYVDAFLAAVDSNELWSILFYVGSGDLYWPKPGVTEPGFSLDPGSSMTLAEVLEILPDDLYPELAGRHSEAIAFMEGFLSDLDGDAYWQFMDEQEDFILEVVLGPLASSKARALLRTIDTSTSTAEVQEAAVTYLEMIWTTLADHDRPWPLLSFAATGETTYQFARYDGGLEGTEAGMTYFYTDILAKGYFYELGKGSPYQIVDGFLPRTASVVPWSHCTQEDQQGRIWFGLREEAVGLQPRQVNLGSVVTRVFVLMQDPVLGEELEIEPSYMFGQGIWWWDRHYQAMADYEPQYHRLDQLMRWGAVLAWLVDEGDVLVPTVPAAEIEVGWRFDDWLVAHPELTWEYDVPFVDVPDQPTETVLRLFSMPYEVCGGSWVSSGGISNPSMVRIAEIAEAQPELPAMVARAGLDAAATDYSPHSMDGTIATLDGIRRTLEPLSKDAAAVEVVANGRNVWSLGDVKVALPETTERRLETAFSRTGDALTWEMDVQDVGLGKLEVAVEGSHATVSWNPDDLDFAQSLLEELQSLLLDIGLDQAMEAFGSDTAVYVSVESGEYYVEVEDDDDASVFLIVSPEPPAQQDALSFRLARPEQDEDLGTTIHWYYASLADELPSDADQLPQ